jgi:uncharacterized delta-60 repeat protein
MKKLLLALKLLEGIVMLPKIARVVLLLILVSPLGWLALQKSEAGASGPSQPKNQGAPEQNRVPPVFGTNGYRHQILQPNATTSDSEQSANYPVFSSGRQNSSPNAAGDLDPSFRAAVGVGGVVYAMLRQSDGRILVSGMFDFINGEPRKNIARLNADGSLDASFNPGAGTSGGQNRGAIYALALDSNSRIVIGGEFTSFNGVLRNRIALLNSDGSLNTTFNPGSTSSAGANSDVYAVAADSSNRILLGGRFSSINGTSRNGIARMRTDGSLDTSFITIQGVSNGVDAPVRAIAMQGENVLLGGEFFSVNGVARSRLARLDTNGVADQFNSANGPNGAVLAMALDANNRVLIGGAFTFVSNQTRGHIARLDGNTGTLDTSFTPPGSGANEDIYTIAVQGNNVLLGGLFTSFNGTPRKSIARLDSSGNLDAFNPMPGPNAFVLTVAAQNDKALLGGNFTNVSGGGGNALARLNSDGSTDSSFRAGTTNPLGTIISNNTSVREMRIQPDGKIIVGGIFFSVDGTERFFVARINADGSLDASFNPGAGPNGFVYAVALQGNKILIGGDFTMFNGRSYNRIVRLNADGSVDTSFNTGFGPNSDVYAIAVDAQQRILIGGNFTSVDGRTLNGLARLSPNGSVETSATFNPGTGTNNNVFDIALQGSQIVAGGSFSSFDGETHQSIARLNDNGTLDRTFTTQFSGLGTIAVNTLAVDAGNRIVAGGAFSSVRNAVGGSAMTRRNVARLLPNGNADTAFAPVGNVPDNAVFALAVQPDDKVVIGGTFTKNVMRLLASGAADSTFNAAGVGADQEVFAVTLQNNNILIGGFFFAVNGSPRSKIARLFGEDLPPPATQFSAANYTVNENIGAATITVNRTGNTSLAGTVEFLTSDGTAQQRSDYTVSSGVLNFAPGESSKTFTVLIVDDAYVEGNETINLTLSNPTGGGGLGSPNSATLTIVDNDSGMPNSNPIDEAQFFVRLNYYDFLNRLPDQGGFDFWTGQITQCGADINCINSRRIGVSAAFFVELEFQESGAYVYRLYRAAFGNNQPFPNPDTMPPGGSVLASHIPAYAKFLPDRARVVGGASLEEGKLDFANQFAQRAEFIARYPSSQTPAQFVDAALATVQTASGVTFTAAERQDFINEATNNGRGAMLKRLGDNAALRQAEYNRAFVLTQYFGYLRRDPDMAGYNFWLGVINGQPQNIRGMVCAFLTSTEYQQRFSSVVTRGNNLCSGMP